MTLKKRNRQTAMAIVMVFLGMVALVSASFSLYNIFCKVTGYGGTTQVSDTQSLTVGERSFEIRFNADINPEVPWKFEPVQKSLTVKSGENKLAFYRAVNLSDQAVTGTAVYNVTPNKAGIYFNKIECFCFVEQTLGAGESVEMPISFFIDPDIESDPNLTELRTITLSYTFFPAKNKE